MLRDSRHTPVLLQEVITAVQPRPGDFVIDGTINGGGHAEVLLEAIGERGALLGVDWDEEALARSRKKFGNHKNVILAHGNYVDLPDILKRKKLGRANVFLLDLGFSSDQLESSGKGFSFLRDEPLAMTYNEKEKPVGKLIEETSVSELAEIIKSLSGEKFAFRIAKAIKDRKPMKTTSDLRKAIISTVPKFYERGRIDPATRTFQALRMWANDELGNIKRAMANIPKVVAPGGRIAVISFHSLEDGIIKRVFRDLAKQGTLKIITKKPITPSEDEIQSNPRSRSAKLRVATVIEK